MKRQLIAAKVDEIIRRELSIDDDPEILAVLREEGKDTTIIEDLGADSLEVINLAMAFEDEFGLIIPDEDVAKYLKTIRGIIGYLEERLRSQGEQPGA